MPLPGAAPRTPPVRAAGVDWRGGLALGLTHYLPLVEGGGKIARDPVRPQLPWTVQAGSDWAAAPFGRALVKTATTGATFATGTGTNGTPWTTAVLVSFSTTPTSKALVYHRENLSAAAYDRCTYISAGGNFAAYAFDGGPKTATGAQTAAAGIRYLVVTVGDGTNLTIYVNGLQDGQTACAAAYAGYTNPQWVLGTGYDGVDPPTNDATGHQYYGFWAWSRALSATEVRAFSAAPHQLVLPYRQPLFTVITADTTTLPPGLNGSLLMDVGSQGIAAVMARY